MGHIGFTGRTAIRKRNQDKHTKLGLCTGCSRKAAKGRKSCQYHLDMGKKKYRERKKQNALSIKEEMKAKDFSKAIDKSGLRGFEFKEKKKEVVKK